MLDYNCLTGLNNAGLNIKRSVLHQVMHIVSGKYTHPAVAQVSIISAVPVDATLCRRACVSLKSPTA
jgi:hypothetical protein